MAPPQRLDAIHKEGRLQLALQAYLQGEFQSYTAAANTYDVSRKTLIRRLTRTQAQLGSTSQHRLLTSTEEESLIQ
jgi:hypothetical protein